MEREPSIRGRIIIKQRRHRRSIIRLVMFRNIGCPRSRRFHMLRRVVIVVIVLLPAVTGFPSAPMHSAHSFQPLPGRFDVSAPGMSQDASFFERSSLSKEKRTSELLSKWHISFKGDRKRDPESFTADLTNCKETYKLTIDEIVKALPSALDGESWQCFHRDYQFLKTYEDHVDAFRLQYSFEDVQE